MVRPSAVLLCHVLAASSALFLPWDVPHFAHVPKVRGARAWTRLGNSLRRAGPRALGNHPPPSLPWMLSGATFGPAAMGLLRLCPCLLSTVAFSQEKISLRTRLKVADALAFQELRGHGSVCEEAGPILVPSLLGSPSCSSSSVKLPPLSSCPLSSGLGSAVRLLFSPGLFPSPARCVCARARSFRWPPKCTSRYFLDPLVVCLEEVLVASGSRGDL